MVNKTQNRLTNKEIMKKLNQQQESIEKLNEKVEEINESMAKLSVKRMMHMLNNQTQRHVKAFKANDVKKLSQKINDFVDTKSNRMLYAINYYPVNKEGKVIQFALVTYADEKDFTKTLEGSSNSMQENLPKG